MVQGLIILNDPTYVPKRWHGTLLYWAVLALALVVNIFGIRILPQVQNLSMVLHVVLFIVLFVIILVVSPTKNSASFVFTDFENESGWSNNGVAWCIGMLSSAYVMVGYDGATHLSEEMPDPAVGVPRAMIGSLVLNGVLGFAFILVVLFCMGDIASVFETNTGFPIIQVFVNVTGSNGAATAMSTAIVLMATLATIPLVASAARTLWSLARDNAFPFSRPISRVDERRGIPTIAIALTIFFLMLLGILNIAATTAFNAILSLSVVGLYLSYLLPIMAILWRRTSRPTTLPYGPFKLRKWGVALNVVSILYTVFCCIFLLFPPYRPVTAQNFNYAPVVLGGVLCLSAVYWFWRGRKMYTGPMVELLGFAVSNIDDNQKH
jgi:choline transport protein